MASAQTFGAQEKLKSRRLTQMLFDQGKSFTVFPVKVIYLLGAPQDFPVKAGVGASSRVFGKAVQRNRIKRLLREAYRTEKAPLVQLAGEQGLYLAVFLLYIDKAMPEYAVLKQKMPAVIGRLMKILHEATAATD